MCYGNPRSTILVPQTNRNEKKTTRLQKRTNKL